MSDHGSSESGESTAVLSISGMTCEGYAKTVERVLSRVAGVASVRVDFASARATIAGCFRPEQLVGAVEAAGYGAKPLQENAGEGRTP